jgi:putative ABC transport system ATP-binding protein
MLAVKDVRKTYHIGKAEVQALRGVSLAIPSRAFVVITGPSGSGKSTLLHLLGCLDRPTSGEVLLDERNLATLSSEERARVRGKRFGFVFQKFNLVPNLSAGENVDLPMALQHVPRAERRERVARALERVGLAERADHRPSELSGGEQQRVAIARALITDPDVLFADEPTGNLDTKTGRQIIDLLRGLNAQGKTVVVVTHNPEIAARAELLVHLRDGEVVRPGESEREEGEGK